MELLFKKIKKANILLQAVAALCMVLFSFFAKQDLRIALFLLFFGQVIIIYSLWSSSLTDIKIIFGFQKGKSTFLWIIACIFLAFSLSIIYRDSLHKSVLPGKFAFFALVSMLIGLTEEFIFRGYFYSCSKSYGMMFCLLCCSLLHACYKTALFVPFNNVHLGLFFTYTFATGIFLATTRHFSRTIVPALIFHSLFDLLVYGDNLNSPWWVW